MCTHINLYKISQLFVVTKPSADESRKCVPVCLSIYILSCVIPYSTNILCAINFTDLIKIILISRIINFVDCQHSLAM